MTHSETDYLVEIDRAVVFPNIPS